MAICRWTFTKLFIGIFLLAAIPAVAEESAEDSAEDTRALSHCDRFMEDYLRSSARKMFRALNRDYSLRSLDLPGTVPLDQNGESTTFEVFLESDDRVAALVDYGRRHTVTYLVADTTIGPIVVSQTWQDRRARESGQACEPILSAVEWPYTAANTVEIEPFQYWGLRIGWRIPPPARAERDATPVLERLRAVADDNS